MNNNIDNPTKRELENRTKKFFDEVNKQGRNWDAVFLIDKINQYYLTGTMQDGVFVLRNDGSHAYFVRESFERAKLECMTDNLYPMVSYKDVAAVLGGHIHNIYIETEMVTYGLLERIKKYFKIDKVQSIHKAISNVRAVKSQYEISCMIESGRQHNYLLENIVPALLKEGINEAELTGELYHQMIKLGYHGVSRFSMFQTEMIVGQLGFGENSVYPSSFNGPGGMKGMYPSTPIIGDRRRTLKKGDLVFVDIGYGVYGYHTDRTQIYMFGATPPDDLIKIQKECLHIQQKTAALLKPGNVPSEIYNSVMRDLNPAFLENFMGASDGGVKFLGHGIGLQIDEFPVIANGFDDPLEENMTLAIEPKKGIQGVGTLGVEDTYIVTNSGGECITNGEKEIWVV